MALAAIPPGVDDVQADIRGSPSSTSRVPSLNPSLTTMISRAAGRSMVSSRSITAATVAHSLKTGTMIEMSGSAGAAVVIRGPPPAFG